MRLLLVYISILFVQFANSQETLNELLKQYNKESIPYIHVQDLSVIINDVVILDAREPDEYKVSHLKNAIHVGHTKFSKKDFISHNIPKDKTIVVYCSLGVRSEQISEKIQALGYANIFNLYGGIFEWKNQNYPIVDFNDKNTEAVHPFSKEWGKWLKKGKKVYLH